MKDIGIEEFLQWAFIEELAKGGGSEGLAAAGSAWRAIEGVAALGCRIDTSMPRDFSPSGWFDQGEAHPDAVLAGRAVARLAHAGIGIPAEWNPAGDWRNVGELEHEAIVRAIDAVNARGGEALVALVIRMAVLRRAPEWDAPQPSRRFVMFNGRPALFVSRTVRDCLGRERTVEKSGYDMKRNRPFPGAYRKQELARDPVPALMGRADYQLWRAALDIVAEDLEGQLADHHVRRSPRPWWPWETVPHARACEATAGRVFVV